MSRNSKQLSNDITLHYGTDHALGYFVDVTHRQYAHSGDDQQGEGYVVEHSKMFGFSLNMPLLEESDLTSEEVIRAKVEAWWDNYVPQSEREEVLNTSEVHTEDDKAFAKMMIPDDTVMPENKQKAGNLALSDDVAGKVTAYTQKLLRAQEKWLKMQIKEHFTVWERIKWLFAVVVGKFWSSYWPSWFEVITDQIDQEWFGFRVKRKADTTPNDITLYMKEADYEALMGELTEFEIAWRSINRSYTKEQFLGKKIPFQQWLSNALNNLHNAGMGMSLEEAEKWGWARDTVVGEVLSESQARSFRELVMSAGAAGIMMSDGFGAPINPSEFSELNNPYN